VGGGVVEVPVLGAELAAEHAAAAVADGDEVPHRGVGAVGLADGVQQRAGVRIQDGQPDRGAELGDQGGDHVGGT
jgi:hypothetical protein